MNTADLLLTVVLFSAPLLQWTLERVLTSRNRRTWWLLHYHKIATAYINRRPTYEIEQAAFEDFWQRMKAEADSWTLQEIRKAA